MAERLICKICGKNYDGCLSCQSQKSYFAWRNVACNEEHGRLYLLLVEESRNGITKQEAKTQLEKYISEFGMPILTENNQRQFDEIMSTGKIIENEPTVEIVSEIVKPKTKRKPKQA